MSSSRALISAVPGVGDRSGVKEELRFVQWLQSLKHDRLNINLQRFDKRGYGIVASQSLVRGSVLVEVPHQAFLSEITAEKCSLVGPLLEKQGDRFRSWQILCTHLLVERARGDESFWHPYISMLPSESESSRTHPLLWPEEERQRLLSGSPMLRKIETRLEMCRDDYQAMIAAGVDKLLPNGFGLSEADVRWASAVLLSRSFSLDLDAAKDENSLVLVPWADMLNHSSSAGQESCLVYDQETKTGFLQAHRSYSAGEEVFDSYGPSLTATQLFLDYGFVDDDNKNFAVDLPTEALGPVRSSSNAALLQAIGLPVESSVISITPEGVDESVLAWTRAAIATPEELAAAGWGSGSHQRAIMHFSEPVNEANESEMLRRLIGACEELSQKYPTSLEQDLAELSDAESEDAGKSRKQQARRAIVSEKKALAAGKSVLCELLKELRAGKALKSLYTVDKEEKNRLR